MKSIYIPATLLLLTIWPLYAQEPTNAPASTEQTTNGPELSTQSTNASVALEQTNATTLDSEQNTNAFVSKVNRRTSSSSETTTVPAVADFRSFKIISDRNIFDANRTGASRNERRRPEKVVKIDSFKLLGTMSYEKGRFAFFDGNGSDYHKTLQTADAIAGYRIVEITYDLVKLANTNGKPIDLHVGMQMKRQDGGPWSIAGSSETFASAAADSSDKTSDAPSGANDAENEVMKRLMLKRAKELNK